MTEVPERTPGERISIADPVVGKTEKQRVLRLLETGQLAAGSEVSAFEDEFGDYVGTEHATATVNGTAALQTALEAVGVGSGDTVLTTPFSFIATANAVKFCGATPVFADIDPETLNLDPDAVEETIRARDGDIDALLVVHLYGLPAEMDRFREIADEYDVPLVEDAAQAHGARYDGDYVGSIGDVGCFSFYPTKNMTTGEGGMVVTDDDTVGARAARFVNHGRSEGGYEHVEVGHNFRMTDIAAAIGRGQLRSLPEFVESRRQHAGALSETLRETSLDPPPEPEDTAHAYHQYTVQTDERAALVDFLDEFGIDTGVYYPTPIHQQPAYDHVDDSLPAAERAANRVVSVPVHPELSEEDLHTLRTALTYFDTYERKQVAD